MLLLWSPIIAFFAVKNRKVKVVTGIVILGYVLFLCFVHVHHRYIWSAPGNRLIHKTSNYSGLDRNHIKVYEAKNDLLKQKLIRKWDLKPMSSASRWASYPRSFAAMREDKPDWWPAREVLSSLEGHGLVIESKEHYKSLWYDPDAQRLYFEYGYW